jgi:hypothetical protein
MPAKFVEIFVANQRYSASIDHGPRFPIGHRVSYQGMIGLTNDGQGGGARYEPPDYATEGHWAPFILPTAVCESAGYMTNINTYDSARFTFGFFQFAAHVPDGDFVRFFRRLLGLPSGKDYLPDLVVQNGRIFRETETGLKQLESAESTRGLMDYLNPSSSSVDDSVDRKSVHLIGHSFGGRVVTSAASGSTTDRVKTMSLLQTAFSHNGFSRSMNGFFRDVVDKQRVKGPILVKEG